MTKSDPTPETLAAIAVAMTNEPYLRSLAEAWLAEEGDTSEARADVEDRISMVRDQPDLMEAIMLRSFMELSVLGRVRYMLAVIRLRRSLARG